MIATVLDYKIRFVDKTEVVQNLHEVIEFELPSTISLMHIVLEYLLKRVEKLGVVKSEQSNLYVALDEAFVNAVKHGNRFDSAKLIRISAEVSNKEARFTIEDEGEGFDVNGMPMGDRIACGYHGVQVGKDGTVISVPGAPGSKLEGRKCVKSFPTQERAGAIFAYAGDALHPEPIELQFPEQLDSPEYSSFLCYCEWEGDYRYVYDNVMDPMHGTFLHKNGIIDYDVIIWRNAIMQIVKTKVTQGGRIVIPVEMRKHLGIEVGEKVNLSLEDNSIRILTQKESIRKAQELVRKFVPEGVSLVDELIADRRREAANE